MAKIFEVPKEVEIPVLNFRDIKGYNEACEKFTTDLKAHLNKMGYNEEYTGEIARFPVADGKAEYMVISLKPVMLVHLPLWDAWNYQHINRLKAVDIKQNIDTAKKLAQMFGGKK